MPTRIGRGAPRHMAMFCVALVVGALSAPALARPAHAGGKPSSPPGRDGTKDVGKPDKSPQEGEAPHGKKGTPGHGSQASIASTDGGGRTKQLQQAEVGGTIAPGDIRIDYVAAAQHTYDHSTGDGPADEYDSRSIGDKVVESLQGEDFRCGDYAVFYAAVGVSDGAGSGPATIELDMSWTSEPSGQPGAGFRDFIGVSINDNDTGNLNLDGNEAVSLGSESTGEAQGKQQLFTTIRVSGLDAGDQVIVALVVQIRCMSPSPTGNLFSRVQTARMIAPTNGVVNVGAQTLTLKRVEDLGGLPGGSTSITIVKDARPNAPRNFGFSGLGGFSLDDDVTSATPRSRTFSELEPGTYIVGEQATEGWRLTGITCEDASGGTRVHLADESATISLEAGDAVRCTFVNERVSPTGGGGSVGLAAPDGGSGAADGPLPYTGAEQDQLLVGALLLVGAGAGLVRASRSRRGQESS